MKREAFWGRETRALVLKDAWAERIGTHSRHGAAGIDGNKKRGWGRNKRTGSLIKDKLLARRGKLKMKREAFWGRETRALVLKDAWAERIGTHSRHGAAGIDGN